MNEEKVSQAQGAAASSSSNSMGVGGVVDVGVDSGSGLALVSLETALDQLVARGADPSALQTYVEGLRLAHVCFESGEGLAQALELLCFDVDDDLLQVSVPDPRHTHAQTHAYAQNWKEMSVSMPREAAAYIMLHSTGAVAEHMVAVLVGSEEEPGAHESVALVAQEVHRLELFAGDYSDLAVECCCFMEELRVDRAGSARNSVVEVTAELKLLRDRRNSHLAQGQAPAFSSAKELVDALRTVGVGSQGRLVELVRVRGEEEMGGGFLTLKWGPRTTVAQLKATALAKFKSKGWTGQLTERDFALVKNKSRPLAENALVREVLSKSFKGKGGFVLHLSPTPKSVCFNLW